MANTGGPAEDSKEPKDENETRRISPPDDGHTYGFDNESVNEQLRQISISGDLADLKAEVERLKERLSAIEAVVAEISRRLKN